MRFPCKNQGIYESCLDTAIAHAHETDADDADADHLLTSLEI
jgi:hypothetical protein